MASAGHEDQSYDIGVVEAMVDLHTATDGAFRIIYNGAGAGASIPWHLHLQMTTDPFPVEGLAVRSRGRLSRCPWNAIDDVVSADASIRRWQEGDPSHRVNLMVAGAAGEAEIYVFLRDSRRPASSDLGPMASFEACGDLVFDAPGQRDAFESADLAMVYRAFEEIRPLAGGRLAGSGVRRRDRRSWPGSSFVSSEKAWSQNAACALVAGREVSRTM